MVTPLQGGALSGMIAEEWLVVFSQDQFLHLVY